MCGAPPIDWGQVVRVLAVKEDVLGPEAISLCIDLTGRDAPLLVQPESAGYRVVLGALHERLSGIDPGWYDRMMAEPLPCLERVLYERRDRR